MTQQEIMNYRADFPLLRESKVAYLDNAATSQRPDCVLDAQRKFYETHNSSPSPILEIEISLLRKYSIVCSTDIIFLG